MSLKDLNLKIAYNTSKDELIDNFFIPLLGTSIKYDRGVGYFSSSWIKEAFNGMKEFANNGGKARWITSPILSQEDWNALLLGDKAKNDELLKRLLESIIVDLKNELEKDILLAFAWMVADEIIEFKLAKPRNKLTCEYHAKVGIFTDSDGNSISFDGSYNDSEHGLYNFESIKVFKSWDLTCEYVDHEKESFEKIWNNQDQNIQVYDIPSAAKANILELINYSDRPYKKPEKSKINSFLDLIDNELPTLQMPPNITLREYQLEAIEAWKSNSYKGIFEMATGTGKTITALSGAVKLFQEKNRLFTIILCPYIHLGKQWQDEAEKFGLRPVLVAESKQKWLEGVNRVVRDFSQGRIDHGSIITTNASFLKGDLRKILGEYDIWDDTLLIADEMHHCGSSEMLHVLPKDAQFRLGLSATPVREYDEFGTDILNNFFGGVVYKFDLKRAIEEGFLTRYYYHPLPVNLTEEEFDEYIVLSERLSRIHPDPKEPISEAALKIAIKRTRVLNNSVSKIDWIRENINNCDKITYTLFYSGDKIFHDILRVLGYEKQMIVHEFTHEQTMKERSRLLALFTEEKIQSLVAMKCLDEGVDVPPTRTAYFLASSSVSREFIQRRGRILRNSPGKESAIIYDLISIPPEKYLKKGKIDENYRTVKSALRRELSRTREFSSLAENKHTSLNDFIELADRYDLLDL